MAHARDRTRATLAPALALTLLVAGCAGAVGSGTPTTTPDGPRTATTEAAGPSTTDGYYRAYEVTARETTPAGVARGHAVSRGAPRPPRLAGRPVRRRAVRDRSRRARRRGSRADVRPRPGPFVNGTLLVTADGGVDRLTKRVVDRRAGTGYGVRLSGPLSPDRHDNYARAEREAAAYGDLAPADRRLFGYAAPPRDGPPDGVTTSGYTYAFANASARAASTLVDGDRNCVRYGGDLYRVRTDGERPDAVRYRVVYERRPAYESVEALYEARRDELVAERGETDPVVRRLVTDAVENGTAEWSGRRRAPERFRSAWQWVEEQPPDGRRTVVRHDGTLYVVRASKLVG